MSSWRKKYLNHLKVRTKSVKRKYSMGILGSLIVIFLILISRQQIANKQQLSLPNNYAIPTTPTTIPSVTPAPTNTPFVKPRVSSVVQPTATPKANPSASNNNTNQASITTTPQPTPTPSLPTLTVQNGAEFTFQVGYDSQYGYTPPSPNYDSQYVQYLSSGVTNPNYVIGQHVDEEFHFKALKTGETTIEVTRRDSTSRYRVIIH